MLGLSWFFKVPEGAASPLWCEARTPFALMQQCQRGTQTRLTSVEKEELAQLRRDKRRLELEVEILKRTAAYFARENVLPN
jgi:transposase-like protein